MIKPSLSFFVVSCIIKKYFLPVKILSNPLNPAKVATNLGVWFDSDFSFLGMLRVSVRSVVYN